MGVDAGAAGGPVTVFLCGDVMTGRGVDQILPHPGDPRLWEPSVRDARAYVALAERANGPIPRPVDVSWPWGDALAVLAEAGPAARVINLETSVTRRGDVAPDKSVHYRMNPDNIGCLRVAQPDVCALANNHVLDFGVGGLVETLDVLATAGIAVAGAGRDAGAAAGPATVGVAGGRIVVWSVGDRSSGIPGRWAATAARAGVHLLPGLSGAAADEIAGRVRRTRLPGDVIVLSIHWGSNWGYGITGEQRAFAHRLVDGGVDIVHGHSSHHVRPVEVYRDRLILYGCGDFIDDYEGIGGRERYRDDLRVIYLATVDPVDGRLVGLRMVPMLARRMRLCRAPDADVAFLRDVLDRISRDLGSCVERGPAGSLVLRPGDRPDAPAHR